MKLDMREKRKLYKDPLDAKVARVRKAISDLREYVKNYFTDLIRKDPVLGEEIIQDMNDVLNLITLGNIEAADTLMREYRQKWAYINGENEDSGKA